MRRLAIVAALVAALSLACGPALAALPGVVISNDLISEVSVAAPPEVGGGGTGSPPPPAQPDNSTEVQVDPDDPVTLDLPGVLELLAPPGALTGGTLTVVVLTEQEVQQIAAATVQQQLTEVGQVVELSLTGGDQAADVTVTFSFDADRVPAGELPAVYVFNPRTNRWVYVGGSYDLAAGTVTLALPHFSTYAVFARPPLPFVTDLAGHWAEREAVCLMGMDIIRGYPDATYRPDACVSRAEVAALVARSLGIAETGPQAAGFSDTAGCWAENYIAALAQNRIVYGYPDQTFRSAEPVTRAELACMLIRAIDQGLVQPPASQASVIADAAQMPVWAMDAAQRIVGYGLMDSRADGLFGPDEPLTRAELALVLYRLIAER